MKTKILSHLARQVTLASLMAVSFLADKSEAQTTLIDFENIPPTYTPVDGFTALFPGVTFSSSNQWIADEVCNSCFENLQGRAITAFPDGSALLSISFDRPVHDVTVDLGSSMKGAALTATIAGFRSGEIVFTETFTTHLVAGGADEIRAHTVMTVDQITIQRTAGSAHLVLDNLSFVRDIGLDSDEDGVPDDQDECPNTPSSAIVNVRGCSLDQIVPCAGPATGGRWRSHGEYMSALMRAVRSFQKSGLITSQERNALVRKGAKSDCGKRAKPLVR